MSTPTRILVVDDEPDTAQMLCRLLVRRGMAAEAVASGQACLDRLTEQPAEIVLTDLRMPGLSGTDLCARLRDAFPETVPIVFTGRAELDAAVESIRAGAFDFLVKPLEIDTLAIAIARALEHVVLRREVKRLRGGDGRAEPDAMLGTSPAIRETFAAVERLARTDADVLVTGESGAGKELVARAIHARSARAAQPFVVASCAALPGPLLARELFGAAPGAPDAPEARAGVFEQAGAGTVLLDELGELPPELQAELERVLRERTVRPVGDDRATAVRARVIATTNRDIEAEVEDGRFSAALLRALHAASVAVPPLRARGGDVLLLAQAFLVRSAARNRKAVDGLSPAAARALMDYDWPGNVRELENCMERAVASCRLSEITVDDLPPRVQAPAGTLVLAPGSRSEMTTLAEMERRYVQYVLGVFHGNKTHAARALGIDRRSLYRRIEQWHLGVAPDAAVEE